MSSTTGVKEISRLSIDLQTLHVVWHKKFAKNSRNICEIFAKYLRKICEKFVKNLQKICEKSKFTQNSRIFHEFFANFAWILIFRKFFANFLQIFHEFFANFSRIFRKYFAKFSRIFCARPREESVSITFLEIQLNL